MLPWLAGWGYLTQLAQLLKLTLLFLPKLLHFHTENFININMMRWEQSIGVLILKGPEQERIYAVNVGSNRTSRLKKKQRRAQCSNSHTRKLVSPLHIKEVQQGYNQQEPGWQVRGETLWPLHSKTGDQAPRTSPDKLNTRTANLWLKFITKTVNRNPSRLPRLIDKVPTDDL